MVASNGAYVGFCKATPTQEMAEWAHGREKADKLWELSEKLVGQEFRY